MYLLSSCVSCVMPYCELENSSILATSGTVGGGRIGFETLKRLEVRKSPWYMLHRKSVALAFAKRISKANCLVLRTES